MLEKLLEHYVNLKYWRKETLRRDKKSKDDFHDHFLLSKEDAEEIISELLGFKNLVTQDTSGPTVIRPIRIMDGGDEQMSAKEMFEEIRKELKAQFIDVLPYKCLGYHISIKISFSDSKRIVFWSNDKIEIGGTIDVDILTRLLKAIQKQVEELGWE